MKISNSEHSRKTAKRVMAKRPTPRTKLQRENADLRARLGEADETLRAIRSGDVDALVVATEHGEKVFTLKTADQLYRVLIEEMTEGAATINGDGVILYCNSSFANMLKNPIEKVIGSKMEDWIAPVDRRFFQALLKNDTTPKRRGELVLTASDGRFFPSYLSVNNVQLEGTLNLFCLIAIDLTEQKRNQASVASEKLARAILENAAEAIIVCDNQQLIIRANEAAHDLCGDSPLGKSFEAAFPLYATNGEPFHVSAEFCRARWQGIEARFKQDGRVFELLFSVGPLRGKQDEQLGCVITLTDITQRKMAEDALQASQQRYATTLASIGDAVIATDTAGNITFMNPVAEKLTGWTLADAFQQPATNVINIVNEETLQKIENPIEKILEQRQIVGLTSHMGLVRGDGTLVAIDDSGAPIKDEKGNTIGVVFVFRDITERTRLEAKIETLARFPKENPNPILRINYNGLILYGNEASQNLLQLWNCSVGDFLPESEHKLVLQTLVSGLAYEQEVDCAGRTFTLNFAPIIKGGYVNIYGTDITKRREAERALRASEHKFSIMFEKAAFAAALSRLPDGALVDVNEAWEKVFGYSKPEAIGKTTLELKINPDDAGRARIIAQLQGSGSAHNQELNLETKSGELRTFLTNVDVVDIGGQKYILNTAQDITERKRAEAALRESEERFRFVLANSPVFVANLDRQLRYTWFYNPQTDTKAEDVLGKVVGIAAVPESAEKMHQLLGDVVNNGTSAKWEVASSTSDGIKFMESYAEPLRDSQGEIIGVALMSIDITERKQVEIAFKEAHADLEMRVQERTAELKQANENIDIERQRFRDLLNELPAYLILLTPDYRVSFANRFFEERFGKSNGRRCYEYLFNRTEPCEICETYTVFKTNQRHHWEWTGPDGRNYDIFDFPFTDVDGSSLIMEVGLDITERKQGEAELAKYRNHLEELVQQRTSELQAEISNRKQAEQALTGALQRLEAHVDNSPMAVVEFDPEFHVTHWSRGAERMFSWTADEVLNKRIADLRWVHEDDAERVASLSMDMFTGRSRRNLHTNRNYRKDGSVIECEWYNSALRDSDGKLISVRSQVLDVTERKELENALKASEEKAQKLIKYAPVGIYEIDFFGRQLISFNEVVCEWTGYTREELLAMNPMDLIGETDRAKFQERIKKKLNGEDISDSVEYPIITKDHRELILEVHVGGVTYQNSVPQNVLVVAHNVTERKKIEDSLRQLSYAVEQSPTSIVVTDTAGAIQYVNPKFCELTGYTLDEVLGQNPRILQSGQTPRHVYEQMWSKLTSGEEWRGEFLNQKKNGDLYWESVSIAPMTDKSGKITQYVAVKEDITERRKMEEALRESEQRFRLALAHAPVTVGAQDRDMLYIWAFNPRTAEVTHVLGKTDYDLFSPEDAERLIALKRRVIETGTPLGEQLWISRDSHRMFVDLYLEPLRDATGQVFGVGIATVDLTELKLMELQIRAQARHLTAIADLSERLSQAALDVQAIQDLVTQRVCKTIGNACFISLLSEDGQRLNPHSIYAPDLQVSPNARVELMPLSVEDELVRLVIQGQACSFEQWSVEQIHTWVKPEYWKSAERFVGSNFSIVPMRVQGRTMGVLGLVRFQSEHASFADEESFLQDVADRTAIALVNAQLFGQIQRARDELEQRVQERTESERRQRVLAETMRDASFAFSRTLNLNTVFDELLASLGHALSFDSAAIMLLEENSDIRVYVTSSDRIMTVSLSDGKRFDLSAFPILRQIVETKTSRCIGDVRQEAEWKQTPGSEHSVNWLGVPMVASNRIVGMFSIHKLEPGYFTADHVRLTETLASYAAASIQNAQLYNQVITSREQMETLSRELMEAEENERRAVARELHDEIGQVLTALKTNLEVHRIATDIATQEHSLEESSAIIDRVLDQVRSLSLDLRPSLLDEFGLVPALEWFLDRQAQRHGIEILLTANPPDIQPPPKIATVCFRVVQAALTNVVRHAHASQVRVTVDQVPPSRSEDDAPGCIELHIADDGAGFDVKAAIDRAMHGQSMGLLGMLERVRLAGGQFKIRSTPGHGTDIHVILPMKKEES